MDPRMDIPQMELEKFDFPLPPIQVESIRCPSMAYRASTYSGYSSTTPSLRSSIRSLAASSAASTRSIKSVRFHETREFIVSPEPEISWEVSSPDIHVVPASPTKRRPQSLRTKWSMPNLSKSEDSATQSKSAATGAGASEADFEAWLAKTAMMGRVEGFGRDERRQESRSSEASRRSSPQKASAETKKSKRKSWISRLSGV